MLGTREVTTIKRVGLADIEKGAVLGQDIVDERGRILIASGMPIRPEMIPLLRKHHIHSVIVQEKPSANITIDETRTLIAPELRSQLIQDIKKAFSHAYDLQIPLHQLQCCVKDIVDNLSRRDDVLLYLSDVQDATDYLFCHSLNVGLFSIVLGLAMKLPKEELCLLGMGGLLHDFGKTRIAPQILNKEGKLTQAEFNEIKEHSAIGYNILKINSNIDHRIMLIALQHHERSNGSGYPWGIKENQIHRLARIVALADVYDALTTDRVYRSRMTSYEALQIIRQGQETHFSPEVMAAFEQVVIPYSVGDTVLLNNGLSGKVTLLNSADLLRPFVATAQGILNLFEDVSLQILSVQGA